MLTLLLFTSLQSMQTVSMKHQQECNKSGKISETTDCPIKWRQNYKLMCSYDLSLFKEKNTNYS